jgi:hypothetical protein
MKMLSQGWLASLLIPIGIGLALLGFWLANPIGTSLVVLSLVVLNVAAWLGQQLLKPLEQDAQ